MFDTHVLCIKCRGVECNVDSRCDVCVLWSDDQFEKYLKHCKTLLAKSKSKRDKKELPASPRKEIVSSGSSGGDSLALGNTVTRASELSEDRVMELISSSLGVFFQPLHSHLK